MRTIFAVLILFLLASNFSETTRAQVCEGKDCSEGWSNKGPIDLGLGRPEGKNPDGSFREFHGNNGAINEGVFRDIVWNGKHYWHSEYYREIPTGSRGSPTVGVRHGSGPNNGGSNREGRSGPRSPNDSAHSEANISVDSNFTSRDSLGVSTSQVEPAEVPLEDSFDKLGQAFATPNPDGLNDEDLDDEFSRGFGDIPADSPAENCDPDGVEQIMSDWKNLGDGVDGDLGEFGLYAGRLAIGFILGDVADLYEAVTFHDILTGEELDWAGWAMSVAGLVVGNGHLYRSAIGAGKKVKGAIKDAVGKGEMWMPPGSKRWHGNIKDSVTKTAEEVNDDFLKIGKQKPYREGTHTVQGALRNPKRFVRVHGPLNQRGNWVVEKHSIAGLTPKQLQKKLALSYVPTHVSDVEVPAGEIVRWGRVGSNWGGGNGAMQYEILGDTKQSWFKSMKPLR